MYRYVGAEPMSTIHFYREPEIALFLFKLLFIVRLALIPGTLECGSPVVRIST